MTSSPPRTRPGRPPRQRRLKGQVVRVGAADVFHYDTGEGPPVVLVHGFNHHAEAWVRNIATLADSGLRVIALDLPGFGRSGVPEMAYSLRGYSDFLRDLIDAKDIERAHLVGSSMGGAIVLRTAIDHPDRVLTVTGVDPAGMFGKVPWTWSLAATPWARALMRPFLGRRTLIEQGHRRAYHDHSLSSPEQIDLIAEAYLQEGYAEHILGMAETMFLVPDEELLWLRLPALSVPCLIVWGRQDRTLPLKHAYRAAQRIKDAELLVYDQCGHLPMYERPEEFNRDLADFLLRRG